MQNKLFKKSSMERLSSPEKLNDYIQVSGIGSWMIVSAALVLVVGLLIWGFCGELTQSEAFIGVARSGKVMCYVSEGIGRQMEIGMEIDVVPLSGAEDEEEMSGKVVAVADYPLSYEEVNEAIESDFLMATMGVSAWNIAVEIEVNEPLKEGMVYTMSWVTDTMRPIELMFR